LLSALEKHAHSVEVQCAKEKVGAVVYSVWFCFSQKQDAVCHKDVLSEVKWCVYYIALLWQMQCLTLFVY